MVAPAVGRAIDRRGGRPVLAAGCVVAALALLATAGANGMVAYTACSLLLGIAAAMTLYDAAFPAVVEATHPHGRRAITLVTFAGGFASTVFWPVTAFLVDHAGWRMTYVVYALVMVLICLPVNWLALEPPPRQDAHDEGQPPPVPDRDRAGALGAGARPRAAAPRLHGRGEPDRRRRLPDPHHRFLAEARHRRHGEAIGLGMLFGPAQVLGRVGEMAFGRRFSAITTGRVATAFLPLSLLLRAARTTPAFRSQSSSFWRSACPTGL